MELFAKIVNDQKSLKLFSQKKPITDVFRVINTPLNYIEHSALLDYVNNTKWSHALK